MPYKTLMLLIVLILGVAGFFQDAKASQTGKAAMNTKPYHALIQKYAEQNGVPVKLAHAFVKIESNYRKDVTGRRGEIGLMQLAPRTARGIGYKGPMHELYEPAVNIKWGMKYLAMAHSRAAGDLCHTVMRYQSGLYAKRYSEANQTYCNKVKRYISSL